jgi:uncharacterized protein YkwD
MPKKASKTKAKRTSSTTKKGAKQSRLKDFFIPHEGNNHAPHMLHPKRAVLYGGVFVATKAIVFVTILFLPLQAYMLPDVLAEQERQLDTLINDLRAQKDLPSLPTNAQLTTSSQLKADDMVASSYFSHTGPDDHTFKYFLNQAGYEYRVAGENLAMGFANAPDVMQAWGQSPLHYRNLIDSDFVEMGLGISSGNYKGKDTVFIANHFGQPLTYNPQVDAPLTKAAAEKITPKQTVNVLGEKETVTPAPLQPEKTEIIYDREKSSVSWRASGQQTTFIATAAISGKPVEVTVTIKGNVMPLHLAEGESGMYTGSLTVAEPIDNFFNVVIDPSIAITAPDGTVNIDTIPWYEIKIVNKTPTQLYLDAHTMLSGLLSPIFAAERAVYIFGIVFFSIALLLNIFIQIRKQHPHIIIPTSLVIILLVALLHI